jgi:hypothetical protein
VVLVSAGLEDFLKYPIQHKVKERTCNHISWKENRYTGTRSA